MGVIIEQEPITVARHKTGQLVTVDQVEKGLACDCFCPECNMPLIAKKGNKVHHHFSHKSHDNNEIKFDSCGYDFWRSLHLLSFKILKEQGGFQMPAIKLFHKEEFLTEYYDLEKTLVPGKYVKFDEIKYGYITSGQKLKTIIARVGNSIFLICPLFSKEKDETFKTYEYVARKGKGELPVILIDMDGIKERVHPKETDKFAQYLIHDATRVWSTHGSKVKGLQEKVKNEVVRKMDIKKEQYVNLLNKLEMKLESCDFKIYTNKIKGCKTHDYFKDFNISIRDFDRIELRTKRHFLYIQRRDNFCIYISLSSDTISPPEIRSNPRDICIWMSIPDIWRKQEYIGSFKDIKFQYYIPPVKKKKK